MIAEPTIGIVMRTKDRPLMLARALRSVIEQTYAHWTLAIVNDGGEPAIVDDVVRELDEPVRARIAVLHHETSRGMEGASKSGLDASQTDLVIVHDDDDTWAPSFLEIAVRELRKTQIRYPETRGVVTYSNLVKERVRGNIIDIDSVEPFNGWIPAGFLSLDRMLAGNILPPISFLFERAAFERLDETYEKIPYLGDWDFLIRFLVNFEIVVVPQFLAFYHWRPPEDASPYNNSVTSEIERHRFFRQLLLNRWLREDLAAGRFGIGAYANLRAHFAIYEPPAAHVERIAPAHWDPVVANLVETTEPAPVRLAIVCSMANDCESAVSFIRNVLARCEHRCEARMFVVIEASGTDETRERLIAFAKTQPKLTVIAETKKRGVAQAYLRGFRAALGGPFDWIFAVDVRDRDPSQEILLFLDAIEGDSADCVFGMPAVAHDGERSSGMRKRFAFGRKPLNLPSGFQLFRREALATILDEPFTSRGPAFRSELKARCRDMRTLEIPLGTSATS